MNALGYVVAFLVIGYMLLRIRRQRKRALIAGLDKPAIWREPAPGRIKDRKRELL